MFSFFSHPSLGPWLDSALSPPPDQTWLIHFVLFSWCLSQETKIVDEIIIIYCLSLLLEHDLVYLQLESQCLTHCLTHSKCSVKICGSFWYLSPFKTSPLHHLAQVVAQYILTRGRQLDANHQDTVGPPPPNRNPPPWHVRHPSCCIARNLGVILDTCLSLTLTSNPWPMTANFIYYLLALPTTLQVLFTILVQATILSQQQPSPLWSHCFPLAPFPSIHLTGRMFLVKHLPCYLTAFHDFPLFLG